MSARESPVNEGFLLGNLDFDIKLGAGTILSPDVENTFLEEIGGFKIYGVLQSQVGDWGKPRIGQDGVDELKQHRFGAFPAEDVFKDEVVSEPDHHPNPWGIS